jgi:hypothetical protein
MRDSNPRFTAPPVLTPILKPPHGEPTGFEPVFGANGCVLTTILMNHFVLRTGFEPATHLRDQIESLGALSNLHTVAFELLL